MELSPGKEAIVNQSGEFLVRWLISLLDFHTFAYEKKVLKKKAFVFYLNDAYTLCTSIISEWHFLISLGERSLLICRMHTCHEKGSRF